MISGPLYRNIISYTTPIIITGLLQLLFNVADFIIYNKNKWVKK